MRKRAFGVGLVLLVAGVGLAACGDDDEDGGGGLTRAELAARGDTVCRDFELDVQKVAAEFATTPQYTPAQMQEFWTKLVPVVDGAITKFEELDPPKDLETQYQAALDQIQKDREKLVVASKTQEDAERLYQSGQDPFTATNERLSAVGITECGDTDSATEDEGASATTTTTAATTTSAP